ncbi:MAG: type II secretion system major pseudopilin GspG [Opitutaceae bacterium]
MKTSRSLLSSRHTKARNAGFSLIEILIVIGLIAILLTLTIGSLGGIFESNSGKVADVFVKQTMKTALLPYRLDVGSYPTSEQGLKALVSAPAGKETRWKGPYVDEIPTDPWGNEYQYKYPGSKNVSGAKGYDVWSLGADGVESADDIGNW